eukprot:scaffold39657_cov23-Tisochrysis_lutea.AAC.2
MARSCCSSVLIAMPNEKPRVFAPTESTCWRQPRLTMGDATTCIAIIRNPVRKRSSSMKSRLASTS